MHARPQPSTLFPYTTLFRSCQFESFVRSRSASRARSTSGHTWSQCASTDPSRPMRVSRQPTSDRVPTHSTTAVARSEEHTSELQSLAYLVCRLLLEKKKRFQ